MGAPSYHSSYSGKGTSRPSMLDNGFRKERAMELNLRDASKNKAEERNIPEMSEIFEAFTKIENQKQLINNIYKEYRSEQKKLEQMRDNLKEQISKLDKGKRESFERLLTEIDPIGGNLDDINGR